MDGVAAWPTKRSHHDQRRPSTNSDIRVIGIRNLFWSPYFPPFIFSLHLRLGFSQLLMQVFALISSILHFDCSGSGFWTGVSCSFCLYSLLYTIHVLKSPSSASIFWSPAVSSLLSDITTCPTFMKKFKWPNTHFSLSTPIVFRKICDNFWRGWGYVACSCMLTLLLFSGT